MAPHSSSRINFLEAPRSKTDSEKKVAYTLFRAEIFTVAAELQGVRVLPLWSGCTSCWDQFGILGLSETWITPDEQYWAFLCCFFFFFYILVYEKFCNSVLLWISMKLHLTFHWHEANHCLVSVSFKSDESTVQTLAHLLSERFHQSPAPPWECSH